jgi:hypothetical protein
MSESIKQFITIIAGYIGAGAVGSLITIFITHRLAIGRDRMVKLESEIRAEKAQFVPMMNQIIKDSGNQQPLAAWRFHKGNLEKSVWRFRSFLNGSRKAAFDAACQKCFGTKDEELLDKKQGWFGNGQEAELEAAQKILISRLQALLDFIEAA